MKTQVTRAQTFYGSIGTGVDFSFNENVGINIGAKYTMPLSSEEQDVDSFYNYYQSRKEQYLENLGGVLEDANHMSLSTGLIVKF